MKYSLIIPHFNDVERIDRLLRTIPIGRPDLEVIVVDDCSPDPIALEAVRANWPQVRWLSTPNNAGAGVARNVGLNAAQGRYLLFADSDDELLLGAFDTFDDVLRVDDKLVYFLAEAVQEVDGSPSVRSQNMNELVKGYWKAPNENMLRRLQLGHVVPWAKVYSRAFIEAHQLYFDPVRLGNDVAFNVLAAVQSDKVRVEPIATYRVFQRPNSLTADVSAPSFVERFLVSRSVADRLAALGIRNEVSATGQMMLSIQYGPKVALRVWQLAICSPMKVDWLRIFDLQRWRRFLSYHVRAKQERSR